MKPGFIPPSITLMALGGCAGPKYPNYYTLNMPASVSVSARTAPISGTVLVQPFGSAACLRQGPIVYRPEREQTAFYNFHQWTEDPRKTATAVMLRDLRQTFQ
jgi:uncharacterized lipoprotein YmbA